MKISVSVCRFFYAGAKFALCMLVWCGIQTTLFAGIDLYYNDLKGDQIGMGRQFSVRDERFGDRSWSEIQKTLYVKNFVAFEVDEQARGQIKSPFTCVLKFRIDRWGSRGDSSTTIQELTIRYDPEARAESAIRQLYYFEGAHAFRVTITDIRFTTNGVTHDKLPPVFRLKGQTEISRLLAFSCTDVSDISHGYQPTSDRLLLSWTALSGVDEYDVEWTYYDAKSFMITNLASTSFNAPATYSDIFRNNSTRITTKLTSFELPLVYPDGYMFYRIRGARMNTTTGLREATKWSSELSGTLTAFADKYQIAAAHESLINWQTQTVFAEDGKNSQTVGYFDGTSRGRQEVSLSRADDMVLIKETIYDHQGRPAVQTMPTPNNGYPNKLEYYPTFARSTAINNPPYSKNDFDFNGEGTCDIFPVSTMSNAYGPSWYYSANNSKANTAGSVHRFIPDAENYPFTVTEFTPDQTGRIRRQGNVGSTLRINGGRETRYFYGKPSQNELTRLFGSDVGKATHYQKNMVRDPNGQHSVSYVDAHGRTIATALAGAAPANVQALSNQGSASNVVRDLLNNVIKDATIVSSYNLLVTDAGPHTFTYSVSDTAYREACMRGIICYDCLYDVTITVSDNCGQSAPTVKKYTNVPLGNPDTLCASAPPGINQTFPLTLQPGEYQITKVLTLSRDAMEYYADRYIKETSCIPKTQTQLLNEFKLEIDPNCAMDCATCNTKLAQITDPTLYAQVKAECDFLCENSANPCETFYQTLLADVSPGGQYATWKQISETNCTTDGDTTSVLNDKFYKNPLTPYEDENGNPDLIYIDGVPYAPQELNRCDFYNYWKPSWAKSLVGYHPEYCLYQACLAQRGSNTYDSTMWATPTYALANSAGLFNAINNDPYFQAGGGGASNKTLMLTFLNQNATSGCISYTLDEVLRSLIACNGTLPCTTTIGSLCANDQNLYWQLFRSAYLGRKYGIWSKNIANSACCTFCNCIETPTCTAQNPNTYAGKTKRWIVYDPLANGLDAALLSGQDQANNNMADNCAQNCETTVETWFRQLKQTCTLSVADSIALRPGLLDLCMKTCDALHPYGATTTPGGWITLHDVIKQVKTTITVCDTLCNGSLITFPGPYDAPQASGGERPILQDPDACVCANITKLENCFNTGTSGFPSLIDYVNSFSEVKLTATELTALKNACTDGACKSMSAVATVPPQLNCGVCKTCNEVTTLKSQFDAVCPAGSFSTGTLTYRKMLAAFLNSKLGMTLAWADYDAFITKCNAANATCNAALVLCPGTLMPLAVLDTACYAEQLAIATEAAKDAYNAQLENLRRDFTGRYLKACLAPLEVFTVSGSFWEYQYTLYYYDQANNLVKTVPPAGVNTATNPATVTLPTTYQYDCFNNVALQDHPDSKITKFWYDRIGRLVASQDGRQAAASPALYSYTLYDGLGRVIEVGEKTLGSGQSAMSSAISKDSLQLLNWINFTPVSLRRDVTRTYYDATPFSIPAFPAAGQENLRKRVAATTFVGTYNGTNTTYDYATHYSYDIAGNVKILVQDILELAAYSNRYKRVDYDYDLVSGKVNAVTYQPSAVDQFVHKYTYDNNNRLINVKTGTDNLTWENDADYQYYHHGPLARTVLGERKVQGLDYAYTLQGWLKGLNASALSSANDMAQDGHTVPPGGTNTTVARDAFAYTIGYFSGDYIKISSGTTLAFDLTSTYSTFTSASASLYNGNIRHIAQEVKTLTTASGFVYRYDQLHRLKEMDAWQKVGATWQAMNAYRERISYDPNGNITNYIRRGGNATFGVVPMDSMTYSYYATSNKLSRIEDNSSYTGNFPNDLDNQTNPNNYAYDNSGNLTSDAQSLNNYTWTAYGKLRTVTMPGSKTLTFGYDAMQNRVLKEFNNNGTLTKTFYIRDAQGNILATYELSSATLKLKELNLYGSTRLGMFKPDFTVYPVPGSGIGTNYLNKKQYELTNHLGNVLAVITDNRSAMDSDNNGTPNYYEAVVSEAREYYPFGMVMPNRKTPAAGNSAYRYGFNGKENDDEPLGDDNEQDYGMRIYDPRVGRFLSVDPIAREYPWYTPYQFAGNMPVKFIDLDGLEPAENGKKEGEYQIAEKTGTEDSYGWTWSVNKKTEKGNWVQGSSMFFHHGNVKANSPDDDLTKTHYPDQKVNSTCDYSEVCHLSRFTSGFTAGITLEGEEAGREAHKLYWNFLEGKYESLRFGATSQMSFFLGGDPEFTQRAKNFEQKALDFFNLHKTLEGFEGNDILRKLGKPYVKDTWFMHTVMGGTQQFDAHIKSISSTEIKIQYEVWDHFGAGKSDAVSKLPGLPSLYWLQHNSGGNKYIYKPFIWSIKVKR